MKMWGISIAPKGKMRLRHEARQLVGNDERLELVPFSFSDKDVIKPSAMAYISNIRGKIQDLLESNDDHNKGYIQRCKYMKYRLQA